MSTYDETAARARAAIEPRRTYGAMTEEKRLRPAPEDETPAVDLINHPPHYGSHPSGVECITVTEHYGFNVGNAIKYLWRAGLKGDAIDDLKKAAWYVNREIARLEAVATSGEEADQ